MSSSIHLYRDRLVNIRNIHREFLLAEDGRKRQVLIIDGGDIASFVVRQPKRLQAHDRIALIILATESGYAHPLSLALVSCLRSLPVNHLPPFKLHAESVAGSRLHSYVRANVISAYYIAALDLW